MRSLIRMSPLPDEAACVACAGDSLKKLQAALGSPGVLAGWQGSDPCAGKWTGISCSAVNGATRVTSLCASLPLYSSLNVLAVQGPHGPEASCMQPCWGRQACGTESRQRTQLAKNQRGSMQGGWKADWQARLGRRSVSSSGHGRHAVLEAEGAAAVATAAGVLTAGCYCWFLQVAGRPGPEGDAAGQHHRPDRAASLVRALPHALACMAPHQSDSVANAHICAGVPKCESQCTFADLLLLLPSSDHIGAAHSVTRS